MENRTIFVKQFHGHNRHYLSCLSPIDLSPKSWNSDHKTLNLFFFDELDCDIQIMPSKGLLFLDDFNGHQAICNTATQQLKFLPPSDVRRPPKVLETQFRASGFGYDPISNDYKVVRSLSHDFSSDEMASERWNVADHFQMELYSLRSDLWHEIRCPPVHMCPEAAVSFNGKCYWIADIGTTTISHGVLSFDFSIEKFASSSLPPTLADSDDIINLVELDGCLGVTGFQRSGHSKRFQLWVQKEEGSWTKVFKAILPGVRRIVGLRDHRSVFLEGMSKREGLCQLMVYDWVAKTMRSLDVHDYRGEMKVVSFVESTAPFPPLRNAMPLNGSHNENVDLEHYMSMDCSRRTINVDCVESDTDPEDVGVEWDDDRSPLLSYDDVLPCA